MTARLFVWFPVVLASCGARPPAAPPKAAAASGADRVAIVAAERGPSGARLVAIDEHGDRQHLMLVEGEGTVRDTNPAVSPDGTWMVFASSRGRPLDQTSLWLAPVGVEAVPVRITAGDWIDSHPTWNRDGSAIVFASTRDGGDFDLWKLAIAGGAVSGAPVQLTTAPAHEVTPSVASDGTVIYASVTPLEGRSIESHLEQRAPDGTITKLTEGPTDTSPALSPDGANIAFARTAVHDGTPNTELWLLRRTDGGVEQLVALPPTDESGPVWSRDGEFVFATSLMRGAETALFSSVIFVDLAEQPMRARILEDHAGGIARLTPAIVAPQLDTAALRADPEYLPELARIMSNAVEQAKQSHPEAP